ncbi:recombination regulator RecX [Halomonas sp. BLK-85]
MGWGKEPPSPREMAIALLARREYSRAELATRLQAKQIPADDIALCLDELADRGWQSDARFAASFIRTRVLRGQGWRRIENDLRQRGVDGDIIRAALDDVVEQEAIDWFELARDVLVRRFDSPGQTPKERARRERFLLGRGFDYEQIRYALSCL